jgi:hypothetical protein
MSNSLRRRNFVAGHWKVSFWHIAAIGNEPRPTVKLRVQILSRGGCFGVAVGGFV